MTIGRASVSWFGADSYNGHFLQVRKAIADMCASHYMEGCDACRGPSGFTQCTNPLESLSNLCLGKRTLEFFSLPECSISL